MLRIQGLVSLCVLMYPIQGSLKAPGTGVVRLDAVTYRKIVPKFDAVLIKFDDPPLPYAPIGPPAFLSVGNAASSYSGLLVAYIHLFEYGPEHVKEMAQKFKLKKEDYPCYKLIVNNEEKVAELNRKNASSDEIKKFIYREKGYWMDLSIAIESLDQLVMEFVTAHSDTRRQDIVEKAEQLAVRITGDEQKAIAKMYIASLKKLIKESVDFVEKEILRLEKLIAGKISERKREQLMNRQSVMVIIQHLITLTEEPLLPTIML